MIAWERQVNEGTKPYEAFSVYRDLGTGRTLEQVAIQLKKSATIMGRWSGEYNWIARAAAYDDHIDKQARKKIEADAIKRKAAMLQRHANTGRVLQGKGLEYLQTHGVDRGTDAIRAIVKGVDVERKAEGLPEYLIEVMEASDIDLVRQYNELLANLGAESPEGTEPEV